MRAAEMHQPLIEAVLIAGLLSIGRASADVQASDDQSHERGCSKDALVAQLLRIEASGEGRSACIRVGVRVPADSAESSCNSAVMEAYTFAVRGSGLGYSYFQEWMDPSPQPGLSMFGDWDGSNWTECWPARHRYDIFACPPGRLETDCIALFGSFGGPTLAGYRPLSSVATSGQLISASREGSKIVAEIWTNPILRSTRVSIEIVTGDHPVVAECSLRIWKNEDDSRGPPEFSARYWVAEWIESPTGRVPKVAYRDSQIRKLDGSRSYGRVSLTRVDPCLDVHAVPKPAPGDAIFDERTGLYCSFGSLRADIDRAPVQLTKPAASWHAIREIEVLAPPPMTQGLLPGGVLSSRVLAGLFIGASVGAAVLFGSRRPFRDLGRSARRLRVALAILLSFIAGGGTFIGRIPPRLCLATISPLSWRGELGRLREFSPRVWGQSCLRTQE